MLSVSHTIISLPFGLLLNNPFISFCATFCMHLLSDMMLHWNIYPHHYKKYPYIQVAIDIASGLLLAYALLDTRMFSLPILAAIAGGNAPDVLHGVWSFMPSAAKARAPKWVKSWFSFHKRIQWETDSPLVGGLSQIIVGGLAIMLTMYLA